MRRKSNLLISMSFLLTILSFEACQTSKNTPNLMATPELIVTPTLLAQYSEQPSFPHPGVYLTEGYTMKTTSSTRDYPLIWLQIPKIEEPGTASIRIFMIGDYPIIPNTVNLQCILAGGKVEYIDYGPITAPFEFSGDGIFKGTITWDLCPMCVACAVVLNQEVDIRGSVSGSVVSMEIEFCEGALRTSCESMSSMRSMSAKLTLRDFNVEPRVKCDHNGGCKDIEFVEMQSQARP